MAAEIEAIRGVAASDPGSGNTFRTPDPEAGAGVRAPRPRSPEPQTNETSPEVGLVFEVDRESHELIIKIVDRETRTVIRQIPPEEMQRLRAAMQSILGTLLDQKG